MNGMSGNKIEILAFDDAGEEEAAIGAWAVRSRLPMGVTVITGLAGRPCSRKALAAPAAAAVSSLASGCLVAGEIPCEGEAVYMVLGGAAAKAKRILASQAASESIEGAYAAAFDGKLGHDLATALAEMLDDRPDVRLVVIDSAAVGFEGRGGIAGALAELSDLGKGRNVAIAVVMPLTKRNLFAIKDPQSGLLDAVDFVWEMYEQSDTRSKFFGSGSSRAAVFEIATRPPARRRKSAAAADGGCENRSSEEGPGGAAEGGGEGGFGEE